MALPSLSKTWQFCVNQALAALGTALADNRRILRTNIKDILLGGGTWTDSSGSTITPAGAWQVRGSSDSTAASLLAVGAAGPGTDRWSSDGALVWAAAASPH